MTLTANAGGRERARERVCVCVCVVRLCERESSDRIVKARERETER